MPVSHEMRTEFSHVESDLSANAVVSNLCHFFHKLTIQMAAFAVSKNSENIKQTISRDIRELPNQFCQNMRHTDAFIEFLM